MQLHTFTALQIEINNPGACAGESGIKAHSFIILALCRICCWLVVAQEQTTSREILLWMTPSEAPKALQASECSELLDPTRANCWISAQHQPGKFKSLLQILRRQALQTFKLALGVHCPATKTPPRQHSQNHRRSKAKLGRSPHKNCKNDLDDQT